MHELGELQKRERVSGQEQGAAGGAAGSRTVRHAVGGTDAATIATSGGARGGASTEMIAKAGEKVRKLLRAQLGEDVYSSWFNAIEFASFDGKRVEISVPHKFLEKWIRSHYIDEVLECCKAEFDGATTVDVVLRQPKSASQQSVEARSDAAAGDRAAAATSSASPASTTARAALNAPLSPPSQRALPSSLPQPIGRTQVAGFEGSPLDPRYTFESFVVGGSNRIAHAAALRVAEAVLGDSAGFNPLFLHAQVGLGKTHLLHAIAWEVKRRRPQAQVLYLTAEGFRFRFVEALRSEDPLAFKEKFRQVDILLIDDLEFMNGPKTEQEFDHVINALLDGGRQIVVASARPPAHIENMNERMRSRLQRGLVTELGGFDDSLRIEVLRQRLAERREQDPTFHLGEDVLRLLASQLTENGRELEGAITRLHANWQWMRTPITIDIAETVIRDLVQGLEPRRIKIEDILRVISRHFGVPKSDLLSQRRHRSVVWPRQIGMYLAKTMTSRSLPEIGRRFGGRDHTTVLHAIRKIEGELAKNQSLGEEIDELKKMISH